ncbi:MAG: PEGA domain-containing protein [Labilithrix sp.]|nr:PEGA domain-containing protein [Labilithrix sp.]
MSNDSKSGGGSDLDIFEGLGKKSERSPAAPPPPPGSSSHLQATRPVPLDAKKTLLGIPGPAAATPLAIPAAQPSQPPPLPSSGPATRPSNSAMAAVAPPPAPPPATPSPSAPPGSGSGSMRAVNPGDRASKPPAPPGRGSLPNLAATKSNPPMEAAPPASAHPSATQKTPSVPPPPASTRPGAASARANGPTSSKPTAQGKNGAKLDMDWDDDNEATHVFDKEKEKQLQAEASSESLQGPEAKEVERASMDAIMSSPPPRNPSQIPSNPPAAGTPPPPASATLSGAFGALGQPREKVNGSSPPSAKFRAAAPTSQSARSAPPPPPTSQKNPSLTTQPLPPPPPPGQVTTAPMHMPPTQQQAPASVPPQTATMQSAQSPMASVPPHLQGSVPPHASNHPSGHPSAIPSAPPVPQLPPVSRAMEATHMVARPAPSKAPLIVALLLAVMAVAGFAVFSLMPRTGTLVVNVSDTKGGAVQNLEILVDGVKRCESAPCIVRDISAGVHEVKVVAKGYEPPAPRAVTVDNKRDVPTDFQLAPSKTAAGTGFKVAANHSGVKLVVDGKDVGLLPQEMRDLEPGEHKLRFVGDRYAPLEKTISVAKDEIVDLGSVNLKVVKGKATIQLGTPGAKVYLVNGTNRKEVPQFPMAIEFDPNERWELQATKDGHEDYSERISFDDGQAEKTFTVSLNPKGSAAVAPPARPTAPAVPWTPPAAKEPAAPTPKVASNPPAAKEPDAPKEPKKEPAAAGGEAVLKINSLPASSIVLDGKPIGVTPQTHVTVSPGTHTIMFVNSEQSLKKTITVDVKAGETKAAFAKLRE